MIGQNENSGNCGHNYTHMYHTQPPNADILYSLSPQTLFAGCHDAFIHESTSFTVRSTLADHPALRVSPWLHLLKTALFEFADNPHTHSYTLHTHTHTGKPCQSRTMIFDSLNEDVRVRRTTGNYGTLCV